MKSAKGCGSVVILSCGRIEAKAKQLLSHSTMSSRSTEIQPDVMYAIDINNSERITKCRYG